MSVLALVLAADLIARAVRLRREATAEAAHGVRQAEEHLAYALAHGSPEQVLAARELVDAWHDYRDSV